ncbi:hypothetical protein Tco_0224090 [Tanacetum coccineum]
MAAKCFLEAKIVKKEIFKETKGAQRVYTNDHMEIENAQDVGRTRDRVDEDKEIEENILSTEDVLSTDKEKVSTDKEKVSTDKPIVSTNGSKVSTDRQIKGTDEQIESTDEQRNGTKDHTKEGSATQATQTPTSTIFGDDETIAKVLLNMIKPKRSRKMRKPLLKIDPKDKGKKKIEEEDESESESDGIPEAKKKFKQLETRNGGMIVLLAEIFKKQEREQYTIEYKSKFLHDTIVAQRKFLAQQRSEAIRNRPPTKNQLRKQ